MQLGFSVGNTWGVDTGSNPTPVNFGVVQSGSLNFAADSKPIFGNNQMPVAVARGTMSIKGKSQMAQFKSRLIDKLFFNTSTSSGQTLYIDKESGTIPGTPYAVTVTNSATWTVDLGVIVSSTGIPLTRVASSPATGQYSVSAGVYTFAAADTTVVVKISYLYTTTGGATIALTNQAMGLAPTFKTVIGLIFNSLKATITLNACVSTALNFTMPLADFTKMDFEFDAFADSSDTVGSISVAETS